MDLNAALKWLNAAVMNKVGHSLREPELVILKGTWRGLTYEQMAEGSDYSTNYLMRDVAPKLWRQLSSVFNRSVGKTNFRVALEAYAAANLSDTEWAASASDSSASDAANLSGSKSRLYWHPSMLAETSGQSAATRTAVPAMSAAVMYGYEKELAQVKRWVSESCSPLSEQLSTGSPSALPSASLSASGQVVGIWGLRGVGKTLLTEKVVAQVSDRFEGVVWRSLQSQPSLDDLCASILASLGVSASLQASAQLLALMAQRSLLIVLEGVEAILQPGALAGGYTAAHQAYGEFFQSAMGSRSCIILTGIEGPTELVRHNGHRQQKGARSLTLTRLSEAAATRLLQAELLNGASSPVAESVEIGFPEDFSIVAGALTEPPSDASSADRAGWSVLIDRYQGHPLALKSACRVIREIFNGQVDEFLKQTPVLFTDVLRLLAFSFKRLIASEKNILYWLASQDTPLSLAQLKETPPLPIGSAGLISVLDSLKQRSLLEITSDAQSEDAAPKFYLSPLVKAYAVHQFMNRFAERSSTNTAGVQTEQALAGSVGKVIDLSPSVAMPVQLSQWFAGRFDPAWYSLNRLFEGAARPAMRLRSAYHLQDETFVKRCKSVELKATAPEALTLENTELQTLSAAESVSSGSVSSESVSSGSASSKAMPSSASAVLIVAIHQDTESLYKLCVQAQPAQEDSVLPANLSLRLLDTAQKVLATVEAQQDDTFIQLPYFRGAMSESFSIELALGDRTHTEHFSI